MPLSKKQRQMLTATQLSRLLPLPLPSLAFLTMLTVDVITEDVQLTDQCVTLTAQQLLKPLRADYKDITQQLSLLN